MNSFFLGWGGGIRVTFRDPASSRLTTNRHRNIALKVPLALFAPNVHSGAQNPIRNHAKTRPYGRVSAWLGLVDVFQEELGILQFNY